MTSKEILKAKLDGESTERNLFCPAIYEHKAKLIGKSVFDVANDAGLLREAVLAEYEIYRPDMLTVGIDIYNVEAQALGAEVVFPEARDAVPSIKEKKLTDISNVGDLKLPEFHTAGRIPLFLDVAQRIHAKLGHDIPVRGALTGPYSIASELMGIEPLIMAMVLDAENFCKLLDFTTEFVIAYGKEYIKRGLSICLFDSQASPPLISPAMFETFLLPRLKRIANEFKTAGCECSELVIGGQTDSISAFILNSGFDIVLCDYPCEVKSYFNQQTRSLPLVRRNISPILIEQENYEAIQSKITETKQLANAFHNLVIGTGVLSYNVPSENILKIKQMCLVD
jgi:uroporphyrinogen decarboxylase